MSFASPSLIATALLLIALPTGLIAQEVPPTPEELTLRPGDTITWTPSRPHRLRFGGTTTVDGEPVVLTPFSEVSRILEAFDPPLTANSDDIALGPTGTPVSAKVRADAPLQDIREFFFTCGFRPHVTRMVTVPFTIAPAAEDYAPRHFQISTANGPLRWLLKLGARTLARP